MAMASASAGRAARTVGVMGTRMLSRRLPLRDFDAGCAISSGDSTLDPSGIWYTVLPMKNAGARTGSNTLIRLIEAGDEMTDEIATAVMPKLTVKPIDTQSSFRTQAYQALKQAITSVNI